MQGKVTGHTFINIGLETARIPHVYQYQRRMYYIVYVCKSLGPVNLGGRLQQIVFTPLTAHHQVFGRYRDYSREQKHENKI
jgi:hypothetical protein